MAIVFEHDDELAGRFVVDDEVTREVFASGQGPAPTITWTMDVETANSLMRLMRALTEVHTELDGGGIVKSVVSDALKGLVPCINYLEDAGTIRRSPSNPSEYDWGPADLRPVE